MSEPWNKGVNDVKIGIGWWNALLIMPVLLMVGIFKLCSSQYHPAITHLCQLSSLKVVANIKPAIVFHSTDDTSKQQRHKRGLTFLPTSRPPLHLLFVCRISWSVTSHCINTCQNCTNHNNNNNLQHQNTYGVPHNTPPPSRKHQRSWPTDFTTHFSGFNIS